MSASQILEDAAVEAVTRREALGVRAIVEAADGQLWIASGNGVRRRGPRLDVSSPSPLDSNSVSEICYHRVPMARTGVRGLQADTSGRVWFQTAAGIFWFEGDRLRQLTNRDYGSRSAWADAPGDPWFGVDRGDEFNEREGQWGVYHVHDGCATFLELPVAETVDRDGHHALLGGPMRTRTGTLWLGTREAAFGFDGTKFDILDRRRLRRAGDSRSINLRGCHLDSRDRLWLLDDGVGVFVYDGERVIDFTAHHGLAGDDDDPSLHRPLAIAEDAAGNLWFGTAGSGVWRYEPSTRDPLGEGRFANFGTADGLTSAATPMIYRTRTGDLLFGRGHSTGIDRFRAGRFERFR